MKFFNNFNVLFGNNVIYKCNGVTHTFTLIHDTGFQFHIHILVVFSGTPNNDHALLGE